MKTSLLEIVLPKLVWLVLLVGFVQSASFEFKSVSCIPLDKSYADFEYCYIKPVNRSYKYLSVRVKLYVLPVDNVTITLALLKRDRTYKPFMYNVTYDACEFLKSGMKNRFLKYFFDLMFATNSNMNHSCPYYNDLVVEKLPLSHMNSQFTRVLPVPSGDYALSSEWNAYNKLRAKFILYGKLT